MAISPGRIQQVTETITLTFPGQEDTLTVTFRPDALTSKVQREADRIQRRVQVKRMHRDAAWKDALEAGEELPEDDDEALDAEDREATFGLFKALIVTWDLVADEPDNPYPPILPVNADSLALLGWKTLGRLMREMIQSISADPTKSKHTNNGSGPRELTVISPNR